MMKLLPVIVAAALATGCFRVTYQNPALPPNGVVHEGSSAFFIAGLVGDARVPAYQMCPGGVSQIETGLSFVDIVLTVVTVGIYTPRSYQIECGGMQ
jgi:hypothetical protein